MTDVNPFVALDDFSLADLYHTECMRFCTCENWPVRYRRLAMTKAIEKEALTRIARQWLIDRSPSPEFVVGDDEPVMPPWGVADRTSP